MLLVGTILRMAALDRYPGGLSSRESLYEYRAKLLRDNGVDELGRRWPIVFSSFDGYQGPLVSYLYVLGGREAVAILSVLGMLAWAYISGSLMATAVLAWSPVMIGLARSVSEWNAMLSLSLVAIALGRILGRKSWAYLTVTVTVLGWLWLVRHQFNFLDDISIINNINEFRSGGNRWFYNKSFYAIRLFDNLLKNIGLRQWFAGAGQVSEFGQEEFGLVLAIFLLPFINGVKNAVVTGKWWIIGVWMMGTVPSIISYPSPNQEKMIWAILPMAIICGLGVSWKWWLGGLISLNLGYFVFDSVKNSDLKMEGVRKLGTAELVNEIRGRVAHYDKIFVSDSYSPDVGAVVANELGWRTNLWGTGLTRRQWIGEVGNIVIGQREKWGGKIGEKVLIATSGSEEKIIDNLGGCWIEIQELKNYRLWEKTEKGCTREE